MRAVVYGVLAVLFVVHTDIWYWDDPRMALGLPIGFTFHVVWTLVVSAALWLTVRYAWPQELEEAIRRTGRDAPPGLASDSSGSGGDSP